ncbi:TetR/AcrR family transcriptional regulator [Cohnella fermenti]|uniref:TetR/AcrR family transcriptional regulator n=1 Tax=Cohnella fermenti TaxID=2565925 RepID=A0A4S4C759_9BACL|nr:TetR/AcrR family transcriptional regulator [Cohnella fermenti]THF83779.1 TetR/AcrR family transcriptional regulator [Cohnella fermenti]
MSIMKKKIVESAERLFTEKGYDATSIQDIADDCSIAKGSLYKFFSSKEDLFIEILEERRLEMIEQMERIHEAASLSSRERYVAEIERQLQFLLTHKLFVTNARGERMPQENDRIGPYLFQMRARLMNYNRELLVRQYGEELRQLSWDAVVMLTAMAKEFLFQVAASGKPLSVQELSPYIAERMDDLVQGLLKREVKPMLTDTLMAEIASCSPETLRETAQRCKNLVLERIASTIAELQVPNSRKRDLEQVVELLKQEGENPEPRRFLLLALLNELAKERELEPYALQMRMWVEKLVKS